MELKTAIIHPPRTMMELFNSVPEGTNVQLIQNQFVMSPAASTTHQKICLKIAKQLDDFTDQHKLGEVFIAPCDVFLNSENAYQPDICYVAATNLKIVKEKGIYGAPDIIIEVLSISNNQYDKTSKKEEYQKAGVKEYFIVDPFEKSVSHLFLVQDEFHEVEKTTGIIRSMLLNTEIRF